MGLATGTFRVRHPGVGVLATDSLRYLSTVIIVYGVVTVFCMITPAILRAFGNFLLPTQLLESTTWLFPRLSRCCFLVSAQVTPLLLGGRRKGVGTAISSAGHLLSATTNTFPFFIIAHDSIYASLNQLFELVLALYAEILAQAFTFNYHYALYILCFCANTQRTAKKLLLYGLLTPL